MKFIDVGGNAHTSQTHYYGSFVSSASRSNSFMLLKFFNKSPAVDVSNPIYQSTDLSPTKEVRSTFELGEGGRTPQLQGEMIELLGHVAQSVWMSLAPNRGLKENSKKRLSLLPILSSCILYKGLAEYSVRDLHLAFKRTKNDHK
ncbi:unnamed protein product [Caretta caretta]